MDKLTLGFLADVLYIKGHINFEEFEAIMSSSKAEDLQVIVDKMLGEGFNGYSKSRVRGEGYLNYKQL